MAPADPARLARSVRVTAVITAVLGPLLVVTGALTHALVRLLEVLAAQPGAAQVTLPPHLDFVIEASLATTPLVVALGVIFGICGVWGWRRPTSGLAALRVAAVAGALGMVALAVVWGWLGAARSADAGLVFVGVAGHLVQGYLIFRAWAFLRRPDVAAAVRRPQA